MIFLSSNSHFYRSFTLSLQSYCDSKLGQINLIPVGVPKIFSQGLYLGRMIWKIESKVIMKPRLLALLSTGWQKMVLGVRTRMTGWVRSGQRKNEPVRMGLTERSQLSYSKSLRLSDRFIIIMPDSNGKTDYLISQKLAYGPIIMTHETVDYTKKKSILDLTTLSTFLKANPNISDHPQLFIYHYYIIKMFTYVIIVNLLFIILSYCLEHQIILYLSLLVSAYYYADRYYKNKGATLYKLFYGEAPHQLLYVLWLYLQPKEEYLYFIPLALSTIGKINLLAHPNSEENVEKTQDLILFQVKCEGFVLGVLFLYLLKHDLTSLIEFITFAIFVKLKYSFYFPSQKAFVELHFALDNLTRKWNCRSLYHFLYMGITVFSSTYSIQRQLLY